MPEEVQTQAPVAENPPEAAPPEPQTPPEPSPQLTPDVVSKLVEERLGELKRELQSLRKALKPETNPQEELLAQLQSLWELEVADLPKAERELLEKILPPSLSPLDRLRIVQGLRKAGKLGTSTPSVGTRAPAPATAPKPEEEKPEDLARRILSLRQLRPGQPRVPRGWEGR